MSKPRLLDLFCGAGGAGTGYHQAGFEVIGVDIKPQRHYPFDFYCADAMTFPLEFRTLFTFFRPDVIHASPPCQAYCALRHLYPKKKYPDLVDSARNRLVQWGGIYVIENVPKSPLKNPIQLCGSSFGLKVRRHRLFESNIKLNSLPCDHKKQGRPIDVSGTGGRRINRHPDDHGGNTNKPRNIKEARSAIGIDWMTRYELSQAIPPAYTEYIGLQLRQFLGV
jgi:DNA (cytosine-5)-methyltransferase 1